LTIDNAYIDCTFNDQDWFKMRQDAVSKKYDNMDEAQSKVEGMLKLLGTGTAGTSPRQSTMA
jgi:hypothetical protein